MKMEMVIALQEGRCAPRLARISGRLYLPICPSAHLFQVLDFRFSVPFYGTLSFSPPTNLKRPSFKMYFELKLENLVQSSQFQLEIDFTKLGIVLTLEKMPIKHFPWKTASTCGLFLLFFFFFVRFFTLFDHMLLFWVFQIPAQTNVRPSIERWWWWWRFTCARPNRVRP